MHLDSKDEVTAAATAKLRTQLKGGLTVQSLLASTCVIICSCRADDRSDEEIQACIGSVGFWCVLNSRLTFCDGAQDASLLQPSCRPPLTMR